MTTWQNCYDDGWKGLLWEDKESGESAFSHPAKFSRGLIFRIIEHALQTGLVQPGQIILDPFGGVALGALPALMNGLSWVGCELESRFQAMGCKNIELWNAKFSGMPKWTGQAVLLRGDSRRLAEVVGEAGIVVSSPPYADSFEGQTDKQTRAEREAKAGKKLGGGQINQARDYGCTPGQLGAMKPGQPPAAVISSPPFAGNTGGRGEASRNGIDAALFDRHSGGMKKGTGSDPANLDHLPMGSGPATVVSGPPYADGCTHTGGNDPDPSHIQGGKRGAYGVAIVGSPPFAESIGSDDPAKRGGLFRDPKRAGDVNLTGSYGTTHGQLGAMKAVGAVVGSPPFENSIPQQDKTFTMPHDTTGNVKADYGSTPNQLGNESGETFWAASRTIIDQCYQILPEGARAIWVVKNYVKAGREVQFSEQWRLLCEACGFETVEVIRAMLVKKNGAQAGFDGEMVNKDVARKSFFRRLHEKRRPDLAIDWETVLITRKR